jgi:hypothetical protein
MTKFKELSTKKKLRLIGVASIVFGELLFLGWLMGSAVESEFDFSLDDMLRDFAIENFGKPIVKLYMGDDYKEPIINKLNSCDAFLLNTYPKFSQIRVALDSGLDKFCVPTDYVQGLIDNAPEPFVRDSVKSICDQQFLDYQLPYDAYLAQQNGTLTCTPSNYIQELVNEFEPKKSKGGLVVVQP